MLCQSHRCFFSSFFFSYLLFCLLASLLLCFFPSVSPPIEWLSDKGCDYIDLVEGHLCPRLSVHLYALSFPLLSFPPFFPFLSFPSIPFPTFPFPFLSFPCLPLLHYRCHLGCCGSSDLTVGVCANTCRQHTQCVSGNIRGISCFEDFGSKQSLQLCFESHTFASVLPSIYFVVHSALHTGNLVPLCTLCRFALNRQSFL